MATPFTPDSFYDGACGFAETALQAHHSRQYRRVALDAGTALEHLIKACLASRSPALLTELRSEGSFPSLIGLLGISSAKPPQRVRTVSLRDAMRRVKALVVSSASDDDLETLVDMRDGVVHAGADVEVEERLLVAFVQLADALLVDLNRERASFWGNQLEVVDALLAEASDKVVHRVEVRFASAHAEFRRLREEGEELVRALRRIQETQRLDSGQKMTPCPVSYLSPQGS
jgi:hypothetical protein